MSSKTSSSSSSGIGVLGVLGCIFVTLKLLAVDPVASWSWWWVTAPFWGGFALAIIVLLIIFIVFAVKK